MALGMRMLRLPQQEILSVLHSRIAAIRRPDFSLTQTQCRCLRHCSYSSRLKGKLEKPNVQVHGLERPHTNIACVSRSRNLAPASRHSSSLSKTRSSVLVNRGSEFYEKNLGSGTWSEFGERRSYSLPAMFAGRLNNSLLLQSQMHVDLDLENMLSPQNVDSLRQNLSARAVTFNLDQLLEDYRHWKKLDDMKCSLEKERTDIAKKMAALVKEEMCKDKEQERDKLTARGKAVKEQMKDLMSSWWIAEQKVMRQALQLPTDLHPLTPETEDQILEVCNDTAGDKDQGSTSHVQFAEQLGLLKFSNAGPRAVYLMGEAAELELSLLHSTGTFVRERGYTPITAPEIFRSVVVEGCGQSFEEILSLQPKEEERETNAYHLVGNSLMSFAAFLAQVQVKKSHLPLRMYSVGRHYQHQTDGSVSGLYGLTQTNRVTLFGASQDKEGMMEISDSMVTTAWHIVQGLGLQARKLLVSARNLAPSESLRTEVQIWAPSLERYLPMAYVSVHNDYASCRLLSKAHNGQPLFMASAVVMDTAVVLASMMERSRTQQGGDLPSLPPFKGDRDTGQGKPAV